MSDTIEPRSRSKGDKRSNPLSPLRIMLAGHGTVGNAIWLLSDRAVRLGVGLFLAGWIARHLGTDAYGLLNYILGVVGVFGSLAGVGLQSVVINELIAHPNQRGAILSSSLILRFCAAGILAPAAVATVLILREGNTDAIVLAILLSSTFVPQSFEIIDYACQAEVRSRPTLIIRNGAFLIFSVAKIAAIFLGAGVIAIAAVMSAEMMLSSCAIAIYARRRNMGISLRSASASRCASLLRAGLPMALAGLAIVIYMRMDQFMLFYFRGDHAVGVYSAAARINEMWAIIPSAIVSSAFPAIVKDGMADSARFNSAIRLLCRRLVAFALVVSLAVSLSASLIISLLFGSAYADSSGTLAVLIWGNIFVFFGIAWTQWMIYEGRQVVMLSLHLLSLAANIGLNFVFIPPYGPAGAALATLISFALGHTVFSLAFPSQRPIAALLASSVGNPFKALRQ